MSRAYGEDLAWVHDTGFGGFTRGATPGLLKILKSRDINDGLVVDLGCGSGIWAAALTKAGYDLLGIDISPAMIRMARKKAPGGKFRVASLLDVEIPPCRAVTSLGECFNYLFDKRNDARRLGQLFRRVHTALEPGGLFIFDVAEPGRSRGGRTAHTVGKDYAIIHESVEDATHRMLTRRITTFRRAGRLYRRDDETHRLRLYESSGLTRLLRSTGFRVRVVRGYGAMRFPAACAGFIASKPASRKRSR